jgi:hypothetical protein
LVGAIEASCSGHETLIDFLDDRIVLRFKDYRTAGRLQQLPWPSPELLARALKFSKQTLCVQLGQRKEFELFPSPGWLVKLLSPKLRRMLHAGQ